MCSLTFFSGYIEIPVSMIKYIYSIKSKLYVNHKQPIVDTSHDMMSHDPPVSIFL